MVRRGYLVPGSPGPAKKSSSLDLSLSEPPDSNVTGGFQLEVDDSHTLASGDTTIQSRQLGGPSTVKSEENASEGGAPASPASASPRTVQYAAPHRSASAPEAMTATQKAAGVGSVATFATVATAPSRVSFSSFTLHTPGGGHSAFSHPAALHDPALSSAGLRHTPSFAGSKGLNPTLAEEWWAGSTATAVPAEAGKPPPYSFGHLQRSSISSKGAARPAANQHGLFSGHVTMAGALRLGSGGGGGGRRADIMTIESRPGSQHSLRSNGLGSSGLGPRPASPPRSGSPGGTRPRTAPAKGAAPNAKGWRNSNFGETPAWNSGHHVAFSRNNKAFHPSLREYFPTKPAVPMARPTMHAESFAPFAHKQDTPSLFQPPPQASAAHAPKFSEHVWRQADPWHEPSELDHAGAADPAGRDPGHFGAAAQARHVSRRHAPVAGTMAPRSRPKMDGGEKWAPSGAAPRALTPGLGTPSVYSSLGTGGASLSAGGGQGPAQQPVPWNGRAACSLSRHNERLHPAQREYFFLPASTSFRRPKTAEHNLKWRQLGHH